MSLESSQKAYNLLCISYFKYREIMPNNGNFSQFYRHVSEPVSVRFLRFSVNWFAIAVLAALYLFII